MYVTTLTCPVCGKVIDEITHPEPKLLGMAAALLGGDGRRMHGMESDCPKDPRWARGWTSTTRPAEPPAEP